MYLGVLLPVMSPDLKKIFGKDVIPSTEASKVFGVTNDYITQLCRREKINGFLIGRLWFVEKKSLKLFLHESKVARAPPRRRAFPAMVGGAIARQTHPTPFKFF